MRRVKFCSVTRGRAETDDVMCKILVHNTTDKNAYSADPPSDSPSALSFCADCHLSPDILLARGLFPLFCKPVCVGATRNLVRKLSPVNFNSRYYLLYPRLTPNTENEGDHVNTVFGRR